MLTFRLRADHEYTLSTPTPTRPHLPLPTPPFLFTPSLQDHSRWKERPTSGPWTWTPDVTTTQARKCVMEHGKTWTTRFLVVREGSAIFKYPRAALRPVDAGETRLLFGCRWWCHSTLAQARFYKVVFALWVLDLSFVLVVFLHVLARPVCILNTISFGSLSKEIVKAINERNRKSGMHT